MSTLIYKAENLKKTYGIREVLNLGDLSIEQGKVTGLLGPNGSGKTTLLEILACILVPSSGKIYFKNRPVDFDSSDIFELRKKVVLVQQHPILFSTTVSRNVEFPLKIRKTDKFQRQAVVSELLQLVGMESFSNEKAHKLSGGETQRVSIAQALACTPDVILMDEPTASVDVENQIIIEQIIKDINKQKGISVIMTTHDMVQASRIADKTIFLFEGKAAGTISENIFSGRFESPEDKEGVFRIQNGLMLHTGKKKEGPARISVNPNQIKLIRTADHAAGENIFKGRLIQLTDEHDLVRSLVNIGIPITVLTSKINFKQISPAVGEEVWIQCPPESIEIF